MYIPKSKIQPNLYTNGGEYLLDGTDYVGKYYLLYNGQAYSGIDQYDANPRLLQKYTPSNSSAVNQRVSDTVSFPFERDATTEDYLAVATSLSPEVQAPAQYFPTPSQDEIAIGEMVRYFLKRFNDYRFVEVNKETYNSIVNKDARYAWQLWIPVQVPWLIKGSEEEVAKTNKQIVYYTQEKFQVKGLAAFIGNNFTKFWQGS